MMTKQQKRQWSFSIGYLVVTMAILWIVGNWMSTAKPKVVPYSEFLSELQASHLDTVQITDRQFLAKEKPVQAGKPAQWIATNRLPNIDETSLIQQLESHGVKFPAEIQSSSMLWQL